MGMFDFLKGSKSKSDSVRPTDKNVGRHAEAISKRAQNYDRQEAIESLAKIGTSEAAAALLKRFTFVIEPSITDQEERESAFRGVVSAGEAAVAPIREFCARAESLTFPLRMLREILDEPAYVAEIVAILAKFDTEYERNSDPKVQLIAALEDVKDSRVCEAVERFLDDVHEPARFHAVTTLLAQGDPASAGPLARQYVREEAARVQNRILEGLLSRSWPIPDPERGVLGPKLNRGVSMDEAGVLHR